MKTFTKKNAKAMIVEMKKDLESIGQANSLPLFSNKPDEVLYSNVTGKIVPTTINGNTFHQFIVMVDGKPEIGYSISGDAAPAEAATMNIGSFVALRDYESARGNKFEAGKTQRRFAFTA